jgi:hypothetical protein
MGAELLSKQVLNYRREGERSDVGRSNKRLSEVCNKSMDLISESRI